MTVRSTASVGSGRSAWRDGVVELGGAGAVFGGVGDEAFLQAGAPGGVEIVVAGEGDLLQFADEVVLPPLPDFEVQVSPATQQVAAQLIVPSARGGRLDRDAHRLP